MAKFTVTVSIQFEIEAPDVRAASDGVERTWAICDHFGGPFKKGRLLISRHLPEVYLLDCDPRLVIDDIRKLDT